MKKSFAALGVCTSLLAITPVTVAAEKWDMPTGYPTSNFHTENIRQFAKDVAELSGGKLTITVHDNGSLFKANEIKRAVQTGQAQIGEIIISGYANENPLFGLDAIPFLASSYEQSKKLWAASREKIEAVFDKQGMKILYTTPWPPQGIYSMKPIHAAADLKSKKWRAYNPASSRIAQLVGAQPVTIQAAELTQALATGAVDAFISSSATGYDSKVWEQVKYYYDVRAWLPKNFIFVSKKAFDALDQPTQEAVLKAAAAAEERGWKISEEKSQWFNDQLKANGMEVSEGSAELQADMKKIGETMVADWEKRAGPEGKAIIDAYRAAQ